MGENLAHIVTIQIVLNEPIAIKATAPNTGAVTPYSNSLRPFDAVIKLVFIDETLPFIESGVTSCINVIRITTLRLSDAPAIILATFERTNFVDIPNTSIETPNIATEKNSTLLFTYS